jgi:uncharacterized phage-associated protein
MSPETASLLTTENFEAVRSWIENPEGDPPAFARGFVATLCSSYSSLTGDRIPSACRGASRLTLESIMREARREDELRQQERETPTVPAPQEKPAPAPVPEAAAAPAKPSPRLDDGTLPLPDENGFLETGTDSLDLAGAVAWHYARTDMAVTKGRSINMTFLQTTLYIIYGTYLAQRGARLTAEHPQMWKYGPVFPRVYGKMSKGITENAQAAEAIREKDPVLDEFIGRIIRINLQKRPSDLAAEHTAPSSPWGKCHRENPDRWYGSLDDRVIASWFKKSIEKSRG